MGLLVFLYVFVLLCAGVYLFVDTLSVFTEGKSLQFSITEVKLWWKPERSHFPT